MAANIRRRIVAPLAIGACVTGLAAVVFALERPGEQAPSTQTSVLQSPAQSADSAADETSGSSIGATESDLPAPSSRVDAPGSSGLRAGTLPRHFTINTRRKPLIFLTIDDGYTKGRAALKYVRDNRLPITVFLTNAAAQGDWEYFRQITQFGGSVENHTMTHASLPSARNLTDEVCRPQQIYSRRFGHRPTMLRPPYGNGGYDYDPQATRARISRAASSCGISHIVMWDVVAGNGKIQFANGSLRRGDIVLLHFTPSLRTDLAKVMKLARQKGLRPAPLNAFLR